MLVEEKLPFSNVEDSQTFSDFPFFNVINYMQTPIQVELYSGLGDEQDRFVQFKKRWTREGRNLKHNFVEQIKNAKLGSCG